MSTEKLWTKLTPEDLVAIARGDAETLTRMLLALAMAPSISFRDWKSALASKPMIAAIERATATRYDESTDDHYVTIPEAK